MKKTIVNYDQETQKTSAKTKNSELNRNINGIWNIIKMATLLLNTLIVIVIPNRSDF